MTSLVHTRIYFSTKYSPLKKGGTTRQEGFSIPLRFLFFFPWKGAKVGAEGSVHGCLATNFTWHESLPRGVEKASRSSPSTYLGYTILSWPERTKWLSQPHLPVISVKSRWCGSCSWRYNLDLCEELVQAQKLMFILSTREGGRIRGPTFIFTFRNFTKSRVAFTQVSLPSLPVNPRLRNGKEWHSFRPGLDLEWDIDLSRRKVFFLREVTGWKIAHVRSEIHRHMTWENIWLGR